MAENTRLKRLGVELKRLGQRIEEVSDESRDECARAIEAMNVKFDAIQSSLTQLIQEQSRSRSPSHGFSHGSNSGMVELRCANISSKPHLLQMIFASVVEINL
ncbi:hypothetical protein PIB30_003549 [Stylosanthes scabra]|uniref:Uncharacterized protein n=1 Tax=Stylosanthes scabra TaxID=79078 RepID=A0ABU6X0U0_9FABA|nr:hypothetical protein [Stylosanthes scabra]